MQADLSHLELLNQHLREAYAEALVSGDTSRVSSVIKEMTPIAKRTAAELRTLPREQTLIDRVRLENVLHYSNAIHAEFKDKTERDLQRRAEIADAGSAGQVPGSFSKLRLEQRGSGSAGTNAFLYKINPALAYIEQKHRDILRLESELIILHSLFQDMAILVELQTEQVDKIQDNVTATAVNVEKGSQDLAAANKEQRKGRKKMVGLIIGLLLVIGGAVGLGVGVSRAR